MELVLFFLILDLCLAGAWRAAQAVLRLARLGGSCEVHLLWNSTRLSCAVTIPRKDSAVSAFLEPTAVACKVGVNWSFARDGFWSGTRLCAWATCGRQPSPPNQPTFVAAGCYQQSTESFRGRWEVGKSYGRPQAISPRDRSLYSETVDARCSSPGGWRGGECAHQLRRSLEYVSTFYLHFNSVVLWLTITFR